MAIFGISDLHLSLSAPFLAGQATQSYKPMDVFGIHWQNHVERLYQNWQKMVQPGDSVLMPGDLSWGLHLAECRYDFDFLSQLNGTIYLSKGNHDYWWDTKKKAEAALPANCVVLQHQSVCIENVILAATRGWLCPGSKEFTVQDQKIYQRELIRLEMALQEGAQLRNERSQAAEFWVMLHYRPVNDNFEPSGFIDLLQKYQVNRCFYGHLHGNPANHILTGVHWGIQFQLLSSDHLQFCPMQLSK